MDLHGEKLKNSLKSFVLGGEKFSTQSYLYNIKNFKVCMTNFTIVIILQIARENETTASNFPNIFENHQLSFIIGDTYFYHISI